MIKAIHKHGGISSHSSGPFVPNTALASGDIAVQDGQARVRQTVITLLDVPVTIVNNASGDYGTVKLGSWSVQNALLVVGGVASLTLTGGTLAAVSTECGLGTTAGIAQTSLATVYENLLVGATATPSSNAASFTLKSTAIASAVLDGTTTAWDMYLNFAAANTLVASDQSCTVSGTIRLTWFDLGDIPA